MAVGIRVAWKLDATDLGQRREFFVDSVGSVLPGLIAVEELNDPGNQREKGPLIIREMDAEQGNRWYVHLAQAQHGPRALNHHAVPEMGACPVAQAVA